MPSLLGFRLSEAPLGFTGGTPVNRVLSADPKAAVLTGSSFTLAVGRKARPDPWPFNYTGASLTSVLDKGTMQSNLGTDAERQQIAPLGVRSPIPASQRKYRPNLDLIY